MPLNDRFEWVMWALMFFGLFFWSSLILPAKSVPRMKEGWVWLQWRPYPRDTLGWLGIAFFAGLILQTGFYQLQHRVGGVFQQPGLVMLISATIFQGLLAFALYFRLHRVRMHVPEVLGLEHPFQLRDLVAALVGYCMSLPGVALSSLLTMHYFKSVGWDLKTQPILQSFSELSGWLNWLTFVLVAVFIVPLLEEVVFRGFLFGWLCQTFGNRAGLILQAFLFALLHQYAEGLLPLFALAVVLGLAYVYTKRLMVCVWIHAFFNGMNILNLLLSQGEGL